MKRLAILPLVLLALFAVAGCGSDDEDSGDTSTQGATVPDDRVGASAAPPELGYYAGVSCPDAHCSFYNQAREGARAFCKGGVASSHLPSSYTDPRNNKKYAYVCFTLKTLRNLVNFYVNRTLIVRSINNDTDRFPETCDNGWCIKGEWSDTENVAGEYRNPTGVRAPYKAEWIGS